MTAKLPLAVLALLGSLAACRDQDPSAIAGEEPEISIACRLDALTPPERAREAGLLQEHLAAVTHTRELADGYAFEYAPDPARFVRLAELAGLEHRCCPFLSFQLEWPAGDTAPGLRITGGPKAKEFVAEVFAGGRPSTARADRPQPRR